MSLRLLTVAVALLVLAAGLWPEPLLAVSGSAVEALITGGPAGREERVVMRESG